MVLVVGATGLVGSAVCQKLAQRGEKVRALVRTTSSPEKVEALKSAGVEICTGDLKDTASIADACKGVEAVISTASSTLSRQPGDSIESVDEAGQLGLVQAAKNAGISRFILVSFRRRADLPFPLSDAKAKVEAAISDFNFTIIQASYFMEVWLSPALGFDYASGTARIYGTGQNPISWVSFLDVAEMCAVALRHPAAERKHIEFGGPEALGGLEVISRFERISGKQFRLEHVPEEALVSEWKAATDPMQKTFAALMLLYALGDAIDMQPVTSTYGIRLTSLDAYIANVLGEAPAAASASS